MEESVGSIIHLIPATDYPFFQCTNSREMTDDIRLLFGEGLIRANNLDNPHFDPRITSKGYRRLREIKQPRNQSSQCFVAMWFSDQMDDAHKNAIQPAIEFKDNEQFEPIYKAVKIDNVEHGNDISDEIIAQIRWSKFMVCDLTGHRGGVYFEAGYAYGLELPVIYTCREDWTREEILMKQPDGEDVQVLYDSLEQPVRVRTEGVHFDLAHRK